MASTNKELKIEISTDFDGKGAEAATKAIEKLNGAVKESARAEEETAGVVGQLKDALELLNGGLEAFNTTLEISEKSEEISKLIAKLTPAINSLRASLAGVFSGASAGGMAAVAAPFAAIAAAALGAQQAVSGVNDRLKEVDPEGYDDLIEKMGVWGDVLEVVSHPLDELKASLVTVKNEVLEVFGKMKDAAINFATDGALDNAKMGRALREQVREAVKAADELIAKRKELLALDRQEAFRGEANAIERAAIEVESNIKSKQLAQSADRAAQEVQDRKRVSAGENPRIIDIERVGRDAEKRKQEVEAELLRLKNERDRLSNESSLAGRQIEEARKQKKDAKPLTERKEKIDENFRRAEEAVGRYVQDNAFRFSEIASSATSEMNDVGESFLASQSKELATLKDELIKNGVRDAEGKLNQYAQGFVNRIAKVLENQKIDPKEVDEVEEIMKGLKLSQEALNGTFKDGLTKFIETQQKGTTMMLQKIAEFESWQTSVNNRLEGR